MANSMGGFWNSTFGQVVAGLLGPLASDSVNVQYAANENEINRMHSENMLSKELSNNLTEMAVQQAFEKNMSSTAYQRARADMEAAGFNPASLAGNAQAASTPSSSAPGMGASSAHSIGTGSSSEGYLMASALRAIMAKGDNDDMKTITDSLIDNAKNAKILEEKREWLSERGMGITKNGQVFRRIKDASGNDAVEFL